MNHPAFIPAAACIADATCFTDARDSRSLPSEIAYRHAERSALRCLWTQAEAESQLSFGEQEIYAEIRDAQRREGWLFGRLLGKQLVLEQLDASTRKEAGLHPVQIEIHSRDGLGRSTPPRVLIDGRLQEYSLSIAHSAQSVLAVLCPNRALSVGADVTPHEIQKNSFAELWLSPREQDWIGREGATNQKRLVSKLWAVKEAFYKAFNIGQPFVPARIEVRPDADEGGGDELAVWLDGEYSQPSCRIHVMETEDEVAVIVTLLRGR